MNRNRREKHEQLLKEVKNQLDGQSNEEDVEHVPGISRMPPGGTTQTHMATAPQSDVRKWLHTLADREEGGRPMDYRSESMRRSYARENQEEGPYRTSSTFSSRAERLLERLNREDTARANAMQDKAKSDDANAEASKKEKSTVQKTAWSWASAGADPKAKNDIPIHVLNEKKKETAPPPEEQPAEPTPKEKNKMPENLKDSEQIKAKLTVKDTPKTILKRPRGGRIDDVLMWMLPKDEIPTTGNAFRVLVATEAVSARVDASVISSIEDIVMNSLQTEFEVSEVRRSNRSHKTLMVTLHSSQKCQFTQRKEMIAGMGGAMAGHWMVVGGEALAAETKETTKGKDAEAKKKKSHLDGAMMECIEDEEQDKQKEANNAREAKEAKEAKEAEEAQKKESAEAAVAKTKADADKLMLKYATGKSSTGSSREHVAAAMNRFNAVKSEMTSLYSSTKRGTAGEPKWEVLHSHSSADIKAARSVTREQTPAVRACLNRLQRPPTAERPYS